MRNRIKYFQEPNGDYLCVSSPGYRKRLFGGRGTAIGGLISSICTTGISEDFLAGCKQVRKKDVPKEWLEAFGG